MYVQNKQYKINCTDKPLMKRVISFSLWGNHPRYNIGAIKNADLAKKYYSCNYIKVQL